MSSTGTTPIIAPDGTVADVPNEHVADLVQKGGKIGIDLTSPDGKERAAVPLESAHDAIRKGALYAPPIAKPAVKMDTAGLGTDTSTVPNPKAAIASAGDDPSGATGEAISGLTMGGLAAMAAGSALNATAPTVTAGLKALSDYVRENPIKSYLIYKHLIEPTVGKKAASTLKTATE